MTLRAAIALVIKQENLNFLLTNRIPRRWLTLFMGRFSKIEQPWIRAASIAIWQLFADLDLTDAKKSKFSSMHDCFIRELKTGSRPIDADPSVIASPCDAIVGACGLVSRGSAIQAKGFSYSMIDLLDDPELVSHYRHGSFVTLRLTAAMYHRFHAPYDCRITRVAYLSGDTWNVNPIALRRIEALFCKNERAVIRCELTGAEAILTLVPVAAILVASIRLHFLDVLLHLKYRGAKNIRCDAVLEKGQEMGWFQHGSTIIVFAPPGFALHDEVQPGSPIKVGQALLKMTQAFGRVTPVCP